MKILYITLLLLLGGTAVFAQTIPKELGSPNPNPRKKKPKSNQSVTSSLTQAENHFKSPDVIPPSPDVAAFGKFGEIPVGLYSGIVPIDVPLYTVKSKDISVPIGLSYHAGGVRVEEIASWTGLGTGLQSGGSISRSVIGRADDKRGGYLNQYLYTPRYLDSLDNAIPNGSYAQVNPSVSNPIRTKWTVFDDQTKYYDAQPDSYNYSFCGRSGKFVIDQNNPTVGIPIPYVPIKITITYANNPPSVPSTRDSLVEEASPFYGTMASFTIIDENGLEYYFNEKETTNSKHLDPRQKTRFQYFYSAWHLSRITSPMGGQVRFSYSNYTQYYRQWSAEDRRIRDADNCPIVIDANGLPEDINYIQRTQSQIRIGGKHISEIIWENGKVTFTPSANNRQDVNGKSLGIVAIFDADNTLKKKYSLFYSSFTETSDLEYTTFNGSDVYAQPNLGRLRLDSLRETTSNTTCLPPYRFGYETGNLPHRYSTQIDHWGYYNGITTNTSLYPKSRYGNRIIGDADRHAYATFAKIGTMNTIQYPTGGKTKITYEGHDSYTPDWDLGIGFKELAAFDYNNAIIENYQTPNNFIGHVNQKQFLSYYNVLVPTGGRLYKMAGFSNLDNIDLVRLYFYLGNSNIPTKSIPIESDEEFFLDAGLYRSYLMIAEVDFGYVSLSNPISVNVRTIPNVPISNTPYNKTIGGLRVKTMSDASNVGLPVVKEYVYRQENDNTKSSGRLVQSPTYAYSKSEDRISYEYDGQSQSWLPGITFSCTDVMMTASSVAPMTQTKGAYVGYDFVEVRNQQNAESGKSTHRYTSPITYQDYTDLNYPYTPNTDFDWKRGFETQTKQFKKKADGSYFLLKSSTNFENADSVYTNVLAVLPACEYYGVRYKFQNQSTFGCFSPNFKEYTITSGWLTNSKTVDTVYNSTEETGAFIVNTTNYAHKGRENLQVAKMTQTSSVTGELREVTMNYPHDKRTSNTTYQQMVDAHIFTPVVEEIVKQNNVQIAKKTTNYLKWKNARTKAINGVSINFPDFYAPQNQYWQQNSTDPNELQRTFLNYDDFGNLTSYLDRDGIRTDLDWFWYDGSSRPIAEKGKTHLLKSRTIGAGLSTAQTFEYDYLSGVGISKIKAPTGYFTYYYYDDLNRLVSIKDHLNFELKHFDYHYRNCGAVGGLGLSLSDTMNYVVVCTARTGNNSLNTNPDEVQTTIQYFDGLGKSLQMVGYQASPDKTKDILLQTTQYDASGRANIGILPTPATGNSGKYDASALSLAGTFYGDLYPFNETIFEASPMNRPLKNFGAGAAWRSNNKFVEHYYRIQGNEILRFTINSNGTISTVGGYEGASLNSKWTVSERGLNTLELSDKLGRIVAKAQQLLGFEYLVTNYIYDDLDRLRYVIPPEIYKKMGTGTGQISSFTENDNIFLEGMYGYHYDSKGRLTEKHIPGAGWRYSVFDKNYREVLHSDSQDRANNYWQFTKYDALNRPVMTGLINNIGGFSRTQLQNDFDNFVGQSYETAPPSGAGGLLLGYTNVSFPSSYTPADGNVRTVTYYDDYLWQTDNLYNFQTSNAFHTQGNTKGMVTGSLIRNLETNAWYKYVNYYDYQGRSIQTFAQNHLGGIDRIDYQYRFNGEVLAMRIVHLGITEIYYYVYDHVGRKTKFLHSLNGKLKVIAKYDYDKIGRLKTKQFSPSDAIGSNQSGLWTQTGTWQGSTVPTISDQVTINQGHTVTIPTGQTVTAGTLFDRGTLQNFGTLSLGTMVGISTGTLQTVDYNYHIRGGLRGINMDASGNLTNKFFSMKLEYEDDGNYFDGNIRRQYWKSNIDGIQRAFAYNYDGASRIISADYGSTKAGESYALENMSYDANGNILSLSRKGKTGVNSWGNIDQLSYVYEANSNKIKKVSDLQGLSNQNVGDFRDSSNVATEYEYWLDGSLKIDRNKKISQVDYNYLKLPKQITFEGGQWIKNQYDASGKKLKSTTSDGIIYDYVSNKIYKNGTLYQISQDEGRIINGNYEYDVKDHLGNLRVSFRDSSGIAKIVTKLDYDPWGLILKGLDYSNPTINKNNFQFGSKEKIETFGLNWVDFGARQYMPDVPHFTTVDPLAEISRRFSPYTYANDNPILMIDPDGMASTYNWGSGQYENERGEQVSWGSVQQEYGIEGGDDKDKKSQTEAQRYGEIVTIKGQKYHKNTGNVFATIGNKINGLFGGDPNYFVEHEPYDRVGEQDMQYLVGNAAGSVAGGIVGKVIGRGIGGLVGGATTKGGIQVTEASITKALEGSTMQTLQGKVSLPMIQRYVQMLEKGLVAPPIKVADGIIVEGNHRYIAGRIFGVEPVQVPYVVSPSQLNRAVPIQKTIVDLLDWGGH